MSKLIVGMACSPASLANCNAVLSREKSYSPGFLSTKLQSAAPSILKTVSKPFWRYNTMSAAENWCHVIIMSRGKVAGYSAAIARLGATAKRTRSDSRQRHLRIILGARGVITDSMGSKITFSPARSSNIRANASRITNRA